MRKHPFHSGRREVITGILLASAPRTTVQEDVLEDRSTIGGAMSYAYTARLLGFDHDLLIGLQARYDFLDVSRIPTRGAEQVPAVDDPLGFSERAKVRLGSNALYAQATTHWSEWFRTVLGLREDYQYGVDAGTQWFG